MLLLTSCATVPSSRKYVGPIFNSKGQAQGIKSFSALWEKRTVQFGAPVRELGVSSPLTVVGGHPGRTDEFPLQIAATLLDPSLIEAGMQHYAALLKMSSEEEAEFCRAYGQRFAPEDHLLVWCELQTI